MLSMFFFPHRIWTNQPVLCRARWRAVLTVTLRTHHTHQVTHLKAHKHSDLMLLLLFFRTTCSSTKLSEWCTHRCRWRTVKLRNPLYVGSAEDVISLQPAQSLRTHRSLCNTQVGPGCDYTQLHSCFVVDERTSNKYIVTLCKNDHFMQQWFECCIKKSVIWHEMIEVKCFYHVVI